MDFLLSVLFFVSTFLLCLVFLQIGKFKRAEEGKDTSNKAGLAVTASIILGWILLQAATNSSAFPFLEFPLGLYPFLIAVASLSMYTINGGKVNRFWVYFFITALSVVFLPENVFIFNGLLPLFFDRFFTAFLWAVFIRIYARMDKLNGLTFVQTSALCLGFSLFPVLASKANVYSVEFSSYPILVLSALIAFMNYKKYSPDTILGKTGSVPLGYLMGLFFVLLALKGYWVPALIMPTYYYFEFVYSSVNKFIHRRAPEPTSLLFFISWVIRKNLNTKGLYSFLFLMMLGFSLIGILYPIKTAFMLAAFLLFYTLYRFFIWGRPKITYRSMFNDAKGAFCQVKDNVKDSIDTVSTYIKDKNKK